MTQTAALVATDLSILRVRTPDGLDAWSLPAETQPTPRPLREAAAAAAEWTATRRGLRKRLNRVIVDVDESLVRWVRSRSLARPVLAATVKTHMSEWEGLATAGSIEPLANAPTPVRGKKPANGADPEAAAHDEDSVPTDGFLGAAVVLAPDALVRLWLDALDRRGVRIDCVQTLWHAMVDAWGGAGGHAAGTTAVLVVEPDERLIWAWGSGRDLLAGGIIRLERQRPAAPAGEPTADHEPPDADEPVRLAVRRLALEWLTWSAQLATFPAQITLAGPTASNLQPFIAARWPAATVRSERCDDPIRALLDHVVSTADAPNPEDARRCMVGLTSRPTRAVRGTYLMVAAALILVATAIGGLSWQMKRTAGKWEQARLATDQNEVKAIKAKEPSIDASRLADANTQLRDLLDDEKTKDRVSLPQSPRDLQREFLNVLDVLSQYDRDQAELQWIDLKEGSSATLALEIDDAFTTGSKIVEALNKGSTNITWNTGGGRSSGKLFTITGTWGFIPR